MVGPRRAGRLRHVEACAMIESDTKSMIRVNQAGEYGATRIYAGQLAIMGSRTTEARAIAGMAAQEERHLKRFNALIAERRVRPTALQPIWSVAGYALGMATALMGPKAAMACTAAVRDRNRQALCRSAARSGRRRSRIVRDHRRFPGRGIRAPRHRDRGRCRKRFRLSVIVRRHPRRVPRRHRIVEAHLIRQSCVQVME